MVAESNDLNQSRKACAMFMDAELRNREQGTQGLAATGDRNQDIDNLKQRLRQRNGPCRVLHSPGGYECSFDYELWRVDYSDHFDGYFEDGDSAEDRLSSP
jgi:hypothetical protein